jgi:hypothetical protein
MRLATVQRNAENRQPDRLNITSTNCRSCMRPPNNRLPDARGGGHSAECFDRILTTMTHTSSDLRVIGRTR